MKLDTLNALLAVENGIIDSGYPYYDDDDYEDEEEECDDE